MNRDTLLGFLCGAAIVTMLAAGNEKIEQLQIERIRMEMPNSNARRILDLEGSGIAAHAEWGKPPEWICVGRTTLDAHFVRVSKINTINHVRSEQYGLLSSNGIEISNGDYRFSLSLTDRGDLEAALWNLRERGSRERSDLGLNIP